MCLRSWPWFLPLNALINPPHYLNLLNAANDVRAEIRYYSNGAGQKDITPFCIKSYLQSHKGCFLGGSGYDNQ
jgi:hypothetical protein